MAATDRLLGDARAAADAAGRRLASVQAADPSRAGWAEAYEAAEVGARAAARRVSALESLRAAQVEQAGRRDAALRSLAGDLEAMESALESSRDQVGAAAADVARALAVLVSAAGAHNAMLAGAHARLAAAGLRARDDLDGTSYGEGALDAGVRLSGTDWTPVPAGGIAAYCVRLAFRDETPGDPLYQLGKYRYRSFEVEARPDHLALPDPAGLERLLPPRRVPVHAVPAALADLGEMRDAPQVVSARRTAVR